MRVALSSDRHERFFTYSSRRARLSPRRSSTPVLLLQWTTFSREPRCYGRSLRAIVSPWGLCATVPEWTNALWEKEGMTATEGEDILMARSNELAIIKWIDSQVVHLMSTKHIFVDDWIPLPLTRVPP